MEYDKLWNGMIIPVIGFGTYKAAGDSGEEIIQKAINAGYRYFDTATFYQNEEIVGNGIRKSKIPREEIIIATKIWKDDMGHDKAKESVNNSLKKLGVEVIDVCLIHWPKRSVDQENWEQELVETWEALEELYREKKVRAIGVCNCLIHHLEVIIENGMYLPMINQIEVHPGYPQTAVVDYCIEKGINVQAWSPLGRLRLGENQLLKELAAKYEVSVSQLCLRFNYQLQVMSLPKASSEEHMKENLNIFDFVISNEDMDKILNMEETGWSGEHPDRERIIL